MTFDVLAKSRRSARPVELYLFVYGDSLTKYYAYTNGQTPITYDADDGRGPIEYQPLAIAREGVQSSGNLDKSTLEVSVAQTSELAQEFRVYPPSDVISLFIRGGHIGDDEFLVVWSGRVLGGTLKDSTCKLACEPIATMLRRAGLRRNYQLGCPLVLYGEGEGQCNADKVAATMTVLAVSAAGVTLTIPFGWGDGRLYRGGLVEWDNVDTGAHEIRTILQIPNGTDLTLNGLARGIVAGTVVTIRKGCNHLTSDCLNVHNNINNYGGHPFIPTKNPFGQTNNFY